MQLNPTALPKRPGIARRLFRKLLGLLLGLFVVLNAVAAFHAWHFTHFAPSTANRTLPPDQLSRLQRLKILFTGISLPKPVAHSQPAVEYEDVQLEDGTPGWWLPVPNAKGTVLLAHGYGGEKASMLRRALVFRKLGYQTLLIDFAGSGASEGFATTIGFKEAAQITTAYHYIRQRSTGKLFLMGASMGAAAILKAVAEDSLQPTGILLECPFSTLYRTVCQRFRIAGIPEVPLAGLLTFWGGALNGFNAFSYAPVDYARAVRCPVLLMHGAQDPLVSADEIQQLYEAIPGPKTVLTCPETGHFDFMETCAERWETVVCTFVDSHF
ncbi:MAG: alpha/beta fold hydrolase [Sphingobacteriales bacterium]|nr:MAG: alpha/beta fold hydrolase [Sphingobacteriales bacterium]